MGIFVRPLHGGMGQAVAERTILRKKPDGAWEDWGDVAYRVALGNSRLCLDQTQATHEFDQLHRHIAKATLLMSGRHLQHGDETQPDRPMEVFTNCATSANTFTLFMLLLNGAGVGRCYDDDMMLINYDHAPSVRCVLDSTHPDFDYSAHESVRDARHKYGAGKDVMWHEVADTREGWAKALEIWENAAFEKIHKDKMLILDFSKVRCKGSPIKGMQNRPSSGPVPLMNAFAKATTLKGAGLEPWRQAMYVDHYFAECVLVGGARRAARMSTKTWRDPSVIEFIRVKRPIEYDGLSMAETLALRSTYTALNKPQSFLWSSNNSVAVDEEFYAALQPGAKGKLVEHAKRVWKALTECSYGDGTGEPGIINVDKLVQNDAGVAGMEDGNYVGSKLYQVEEDTRLYLSRLAKKALKKPYRMITNPCGEIALAIWGGYCVIADVVPFHADALDEAEEAFRVATRALMRVNLMDCLYRRETRRTGRIGVGMTGVHEFAWKFFKVGFRDLIKPLLGEFDELLLAGDSFESLATSRHPGVRAAAFWHTLRRFSHAVADEATRYAAILGVEVPHTWTTIKPAGTTSKLFGLTEGWHLPAMREYLRYVQFRNDDPLVEVYRAKGYPVTQLTTYRGHTIVGFPTQPTICSLGMGDKLVTADEATPEEQYRWLQLGEQFYITGETPSDRGNQISYTLKYDPTQVGFAQFSEMMLKYQPLIRCCSVMPTEGNAAHEYLPETAVTKAEYEAISAAISERLQEDIGKEHLDCANGGVCPINFDERARKELGTPQGALH